MKKLILIFVFAGVLAVTAAGAYGYADVVVCEPQGGGNPIHPVTYWYDVTPDTFGRCDFHVRVFDSNPTNYTNWTISPWPGNTWRFLVHQVGNEWWASWWDSDPGCSNAFFSTTRFRFDNPNPSVWGDWTTTTSNSSDPYAGVVDSSGAHATEPDGNGYRVHVPEGKPVAERLKWSQPPIEWDPNSWIPVYCGWDEVSYREWADPTWFECWNFRTQCHGNADCDGDVDDDDMIILMNAWGTVYPDPTYDECADFNRDLWVDDLDLTILLDNFGTYPPADCWLRPEVTRVAADDFRCLGTMPIESIHWWGSHFGWENPEELPPDLPNAWRFGIWTNVPADPYTDPNYSHPGTLLWDVEVPADRVKMEQVGTDDYHGWFPYDVCYQYYVDLEPEEVFWQNDFLETTEDDIFWLSIVALYPDPCELPYYPWGWKTRPWSWMDDAVTFWLYEEPEPCSTDPCFMEPIIDPIWGESFDLAFELDTDAKYIKWEQPFTGIRNWPHYWDELSMARVEGGIPVKWEQLPDLAFGMDVDATNPYYYPSPTWEPQILADDFPCTTTGPITDVHIWASWYHDFCPYWDPLAVEFTLSIHSDNPIGPGGWSEPDEPLWIRDFGPGEFDAWEYSFELEGFFVPCEWYYEPDADFVCWRYDFTIDPAEAFIQEGSPGSPVVYWLDVQARPLFDPMAMEPVRFGWKTSEQPWNDDAVWAEGYELNHSPWEELLHPETGESLDLAFAITSEGEQFNILRLVADDWRCDNNTPITAAVWSGSYLGYLYEACQGPQMALPVKPDYFLLRIWTDVPEGVQQPYSHPGDIIWEYEAYDYDEVLVGYDKFPEGGEPGPREPVFRYSVRLPHEAWFLQEEPNDIYWFSVLAVYDQNVPNYDWGWTNHSHVYNDDAVEGFLDAPGGPSGWTWYELFDQTGESEDMSFILFTDPNGYTCWDPVECPGQPLGDATCDGNVNAVDIFRVKQSWLKVYGQVGYNCCADFDHNKRVNAVDLFRLKQNWLAAGLGGNGNQNCPP